jgi:hypothetical protein
MKKTFLAAAVAVFLGHDPAALAQNVPWRAVIGDNSGVTVPGLPAGSRSVTDELLGDLGKGYVSVRITSPDTAQGYWAMKQGSWTQYTKIGVSGATQGPGRTGGEAGHVFSSINSGGSGAGADGQRVFIGRAGVPNDTTTSTWGVWRWDTTQNVEVARGNASSGPLGPNIDADWAYLNQSDTFQGARAMNGGQVLVNAYVQSPTGASALYLAKSVPGEGMKPCALRNSTDRRMAPNLADGDTFNSSWSFSNLTLTPDNRVFGALSASGSRAGIWELCSGSGPVALVVDGETGARGPDIGVATAVFTEFEPANPGNPGSLYFFARFRPTSSDLSRLGLFWHDGTSSKPLAMNDTAGVYGPNWRGSTWSSFDTGSLTSAGEYVAFQAQVATTDGGSPSGLWRVRAGGTPQLVAIRGLNETGPEAGRQWDVFYGNAVLANGDIIAEARTQPGNEYAVWLLKNDGSAPRRVLKVGQSVSVPTASGVVQAAVTSYEVPSGAAQYSRGGDYWIGADGSLLINANVATYGAVTITALPSNPIDKIFANGFDGAP